MSNCQELITIFERISSRIDKGAENYCQMTKYVTHRIEAEEKIAQMLRALIPTAVDAGDPITTAFVEDLKSEAETHLTFANDMRKQITGPANQYTATMREKQKRIQSLIRASKTNVQKALSETEKAQREVDLQRSRCNGLAGPQLTKQQQKVAKAAQDYQVKSKNEAQAAQTISSQNVPSIHREFSEFDSGRLQKLQKVAVNFIQLKKNLSDSVGNGCSSFNGKMATYDGKDRSERYIARVFDTTVTESNLQEGDTDLNAVAIADYISDEPNDLQFVRGDRIKVITQHHSGWWEGQIADKIGTFPRTFVMLPGDVDLRKDPIGAVFLVIQDYNKNRGGDISLLTGDLVFVDYVSKDRCSGTNLRDKKRGYFPLECLECRI